MNREKSLNPMHDTSNSFESLFSGVIGKDYHMLKLICPLATEMSRLVGQKVGQFKHDTPGPLNVVEIGSGTGITTLSILSSGKQMKLTSIEIEPTMLRQAETNLQDWVNRQFLEFIEQDALSALQTMDDETADVIASAYTIHNFSQSYREQVINEIYRVLKPGGLFVNGDRYALDDPVKHTEIVQQEISGYFKVLVNEERLDLLEHWILHLFNDESETHIMRETPSLNQIHQAGFERINLTNRMEVNALVTAMR